MNTRSRVVTEVAPIPQPSQRWRPEIQGLRAVAVLLVVFFHVGLLDGGFVGVDVFFVISGFLISRQLIESPSLEPGLKGHGSTLLDFYERRVRRIIPSASLVIVLTAITGRWVLNPLDWRELSGDSAASSTFVMNLRLQEQGVDYLRADVAPSALQHYWSLAIEEQFYLFWPIAVLLVRPIHRHAVALLVAVGVLASLGWMLLSDGDATAAFFGLPTRAWQLLAGAAAFLALRRWPAVARGSRLLDVCSLVFLAMVVFVAGPETTWPGLWTVVLTIAVVVVVMSPGPLTRAILIPKPLQWIGDRSFSWYLLHFPPLIFAEAITEAPVGPVLGLGISLGTLAAADLMYRRFEQPMRRTDLTRRSVLALGLLAIVIVGGSSALAQRWVSFEGGAASSESAVRLEDAQERSPLLDQEASRVLVPRDLQPAIGDARADRHEAYVNGCHADINAQTAEPCLLVRGGGNSVLILGDSHAVNWLPAFEDIARSEEWTLFALTKSGCTPADAETHLARLDRWYSECPAWRTSAIEQIGLGAYDAIVVAGASSYPNSGPTAERFSPDDWEAALAATLERLASRSDVYYLEDTTRFPHDVPGCLSEHLRSAQRCAVSVADGVNEAYGQLERRAVASADVNFVATRHIVCGDTSCPTFVGSTLWYRDSHHFTTAASSGFATLLREALWAEGFPE